MEADIKFQPVKKQKTVWLGVLFVALFVGGSGWLIENQRLAYPPLNSPAPSPGYSAENKPYQSEKMDIAFDYPSDWMVNEKEGMLGLVSSSSLQVMSKDRGGVNPDYADINIELKDNSEKLSLEDYVQKYDADLAEKYSQKKTTRIAGKKALYFRDTVEQADQFPVLLIFVKKNDQQIVLITLHWFYDLAQNGLAPVFDTLISTLSWQ